MQISALPLLFLLSSLFSSSIAGFEPAPSPVSGDGDGSPAVNPSPPTAALSEPPAPAESLRGKYGAPVPEPVKKEESEDGGSDEIPASSAEEDTESATVRWCAVREEFVNCQHFVSLFAQSDGYTWKCVQRDTTLECLDSIKKGQADVINLEAGLAYFAFINYSMKAIANEVYCNSAESYEAVAVVSREACMANRDITLMDFKGLRSCHGGYSTAAGWNYPIAHIRTSVYSEKKNDWELAASFFTEVCAPSELEFEGLGFDQNSSCQSNSVYFGHSGAFRCLLEELGDIAFVKGDTALLYSMEGPHNQSWSTKSLRDFMYLCPKGGCREINGYPGTCSLGTVPANVVMGSNSILNKKRLVILQTLLNSTTWVDASYTGEGHIISPSTQALAAVKQLTRSYLGKSALISQSIQELNQVNLSTVNNNSDIGSSLHINHVNVITIVSILTVLTLPVSVLF
ncbi:uncharacterized protein LOC131165634 isoform X2 [Malania oleifera]|uniref:uncharacterized protein LOC131165634 isoform X2 n=1 Tax=Malania oleifera TaxID=397392 RepID=UPI0025ADBC46|nr:uncharacterized protein LOC131165634 isoform X2 [Malania oleifera]